MSLGRVSTFMVSLLVILIGFSLAGFFLVAVDLCETVVVVVAVVCFSV